MGEGMDLGFPDVCLTPPLAIPLPYPDEAETVTTAPAAYNVMIDCMPVINMGSIGLVSLGDDAGILLGVVSHMISGDIIYEVGCFTIFVDGMPAQRLTSITGQNSMFILPNAPGMCIVPSQVTVLALG